jgi:hypothetical protein
MRSSPSSDEDVNTMASYVFKMSSLCLWTIALSLRASEVETVTEGYEDSQEIIEECNLYLQCIPRHLGCDCCVAINKLLNTDKYKYVAEKMRQLNGIKNLIENKGITYEKLLVTLSNVFSACDDFYAPIFCKNVRKKLVRKVAPEQVVTGTCDICFHDDKTNIIILDCGHILCKNCLESFRLKACPWCQVSIQGMYEMKRCLLCKRNLANTLNKACGHFDVCEDCAQQKKHQSCLICGSNKGHIIKKIYLN